MANPASLTINALSANSSIAQPAVQTIDTAGTVNCAAGSVTDRLFIEVLNNHASNSATVTVKAGANPPSHRAGVGDLAVTVAATTTKLIGPLEAARFAKADGSVDVAFAGTSPDIKVRVYRLPKSV